MKITYFHHLLISTFLWGSLANAQFFPQASSGSQTTHGTLWFGRTQIKSHTMKVEIEAGYLDVVEEVEIGAAESFGRTPEPAGDRNSLEVTGSFHLPTGSAVTGLLIWNGETVLKGKLKPAGTANQQYEDFVDRNTSPPIQPRDPFFIRQLALNPSYESYEFKIYPVIWKEFRKVRVRYLVPRRVPAKASGLYMPSPIFSAPIHEGGFHCHLASRIGFTRVDYRQGSDSKSSELPASITRSYGFQEAIEFKLTPEIPAQWLQTSISDGDWEGHYLQFHAPFPKKALEEAGLIRETVFLWKWNHPEAFFETKDGKPVPTAWGMAAKDQARRILQVSDVVWENEGEVGLVLHTGDRHRPKTFGMGPKGGAPAERIKEVLNSIAADDYWTELAEQIKKPNDPELNRPSEAQNGFIGFHLAVRAAYSLFSPEENRIRTILLLTVGPRLPGDSPIADTLDLDFLKNASLSPVPHVSNRLEWPGVDLQGLVAGGKFRTHVFDPGSGLPVFGIQSLRMRFTAGAEEFSRDMDVPGFGLSATQQVLQFAGHATATWSTEMRLEMVSVSGRLRGTSHTFQPVDSPNDTNLVKLWSKASFRVSGKFPQSDLGAIFGVVDRSNALLALDHDVAPAHSEGEILAGGIPHLQPGEIFAPPKTSQPTRIKSTDLFANTRISIRRGWAEFQLPAFRSGTIKIATLSGQVLKTETLPPGLGRYGIKLPDAGGYATLILVMEVDGKIRRFLLAGASLK